MGRRSGWHRRAVYVFAGPTRCCYPRFLPIRQPLHPNAVVAGQLRRAGFTHACRYRPAELGRTNRTPELDNLAGVTLADARLENNRLLQTTESILGA